MRAFAIIGILAIAFTAVSCNNTTPNEEPVPTGESVSTVPSITTVTYDPSVMADQREISRIAELESGMSPSPTTPPEATPEDATSTESNDPIADVKKIVESMITDAKLGNTTKLAGYLVDDQAKQLNDLVEAGKTLMEKFEQAEKLSKEKLDVGIPGDIPKGVKSATETEKNHFAQTLVGRKISELTFTESEGKVSVVVGQKTKQQFLTFSKVDNAWKAEMAATWINSVKSGTGLATRYTNLLSDAMTMLEDGSMTKENYKQKYDELRQKYKVLVVAPRPD